MTFRELLNAIKPVGDELLIDFLEDDLQKCYTEYFRCYHTLEEHILPELELFERVRGLCEEPLLVELAWYYHDIIYIPGSPNSEIISADKAFFDCIQLGYSPSIASTVKNLVMATQHFKTFPNTQDEKIIHDLDLAILGADPDKYNKYAKQIRKEYSYVENRDFAHGRLSVLDHFIQRSGSPSSMKKTLFKTQYFIDTFELKAVENLRQEIEDIKKVYPLPE